MKKYVILSLALIILMACKHKEDFHPRAINFDRDVCYICKMGLTDQRYNVQAINAYGEVRWYDDIGCLAEDVRDQEQWQLWKGEQYKAWIGDASKANEPNNWIDAHTAFYDYGKHTPMGYGYSAYEIKPDTGEVFSYEEVLERINKGFTMREAFLKEKMMMHQDNPEMTKKIKNKLEKERHKKQ